MIVIRKNDFRGGRSPRPRLALVLALAQPLLLAACQTPSAEADAKAARRAEAREVFSSKSSRAGDHPSGDDWCIVLMTFTGDDALTRARAAAESLAQTPALAGATAQERKEGAVVVLGAYPAPTDAKAREDLERVRSTLIAGRPMFARSFIAPRTAQAAGAAGAVPQLSLTEARRENGAGPLYTLQVGVYESEDRSEAMRQAERAVIELRAEGELAYYHHGRQRSMVTIGIFGPDAIDAQTGELSPELELLRKRRPFNLYNGKGIAERVGGRSQARLQVSQLVSVP